MRSLRRCYTRVFINRSPRIREYQCTELKLGCRVDYGDSQKCGCYDGETVPSWSAGCPLLLHRAGVRTSARTRRYVSRSLFIAHLRYRAYNYVRVLYDCTCIMEVAIM